MEHVSDAANQIADRARSTRSQTSSENGVPAKPQRDPETTTTRALSLPDSLLDGVFLRMSMRYGHRWSSQYQSDAPDVMAVLYAEWGETLAMLTPRQIAHGFRVDGARGTTWPPGSTEFAAMCFGVPTIEQVKVEARRPAEGRLQPFMRMVWSFLDGFAFARANAGQSDRMLVDAYTLARAHVLSNHAMPQPIAGVIERQAPEPKTPAPPEVAAEYIEQMRSVLRATEEPNDPIEGGK